MKTAVVYYSLEGHAKTVCELISQRLGADLVELRCLKPYATSGPGKYVRSSKDTITGAKPELEAYKFDPRSYDLVILAAPCWAGKPAAPLNTFLHDNDLSGLRKAVVITCKAANAAAKYGEVMRATCGADANAPVLALSEQQLANDAELDAALDTFCAACEKVSA